MPRTPMDILERAYALEAEGYDELPWFKLLGRDWIEDEVLRAAVRALRNAGLICETSSPGYFRLS